MTKTTVEQWCWYWKWCAGTSVEWNGRPYQKLQTSCYCVVHFVAVGNVVFGRARNCSSWPGCSKCSWYFDVTLLLLSFSVKLSEGPALAVLMIIHNYSNVIIRNHGTILIDRENRGIYGWFFSDSCIFYWACYRHWWGYSSVVIVECMDCICLHVKQFRVRIK